MFRKEFTNKEWNRLDWKKTNMNLGENENVSCGYIAEKLGYEKTNIKDNYSHELYKKDGKLYFIEKRNNGVEIAEADFNGEYKSITYMNKKNKILYSEDAYNSMLKMGSRETDFEIIKK